MNTPHVSVMPDEVLVALRPERAGYLVDLTLGAGGHAALLMQHASSTARLLATDRDVTAHEIALARLEPFAERLTVVHADYRGFGDVLEENGFGIDDEGRRRVDAILLDAGVSSMQLDRGERGFSWRSEAPLDMRMDASEGLTAGEWLDQTSPSELRRVLRDYGEVKRAGRLANQIIERRREGSLQTTTELAALCDEMAGPQERKKSIHPATLVFQAIRIAVNDELKGLEQAVQQIPGRLTKGGRAAVISFHSLEDRIVKRAFRDATRKEIPRGLPVRGDQSTEFRLVGGVQQASDVECDANPRARSAKLRVIERAEDTDA